MPKKRIRCEAYSAFLVNMNRSVAFLRMFDQPGGVARGVGQPSSDEKELLRGAVVFAVGALDAFLHELILEIVPRFGGAQVALSEALKQIAKDDPALALRMNLERHEADKRRAFAGALDVWLSQKSFQGPEAVMRALSYMGCGLKWDAFDAESGKDTAEGLTHFTDLRHKMVHRGEKPTIGRASAGECVDLVEAIAKLVNRETVRFYHS